MSSDCRLGLAPFLSPSPLPPPGRWSSGEWVAPARRRAARAAWELAAGTSFPISAARAAKLPGSGASPGCAGALLPSPRVQFPHHEPGRECFASSQGRSPSRELPSIARLLGRAANMANACREPALGEGERWSFSFPLFSMPVATKLLLHGEKEGGEATPVAWTQSSSATATRRLQEVCWNSDVFQKYFANQICLGGRVPTGSIKKEILQREISFYESTICFFDSQLLLSREYFYIMLWVTSSVFLFRGYSVISSRLTLLSIYCVINQLASEEMSTEACEPD